MKKEINIKNKKSTYIILIVSLVILFLIPIKVKLKNSNTVQYISVFYKITKVNKVNIMSTTRYETGTIVEVLDIEVFNNVKRKTKYIKKEELVKAQDEMLDIISSKKDYNNFSGCSLDEDSMTISVFLVDNSVESQEYFRKNIHNSKYIVFFQGNKNITY